MDFGTNCHLHTCLHLSFLPLSCPYCHHDFCESHFLPRQHNCDAPGSRDKVLSENEVLKRALRANDRATEGRGGARLPCQKRGCKSFSLEVGSVSSARTGTGGGGNSSQMGQRTRIVVKDGQEIQDSATPVEHSAPTCINCRGLYCTSHITPRAHDCQAPPAPTQGQKRMEAAEERKRKAREILSKNFASRAGATGTSGTSKK